MISLQVIKINSSGELVKRWQYFLIGKGFYNDEASGQFDETTQKATIEFQKKYNLQPDGVVGNKSYGVAMQLGFEGVTESDTSIQSANWPPKPDFPPLADNAQRQEIFGKFSYVHDPQAGNRENIRITDDWESKNITTIQISQLINIKGNDKVRFNKLAANQIIKLWAEWESSGLLHHVLTWEGSFVPRFVRGSTTVLSNHSFGLHSISITHGTNWEAFPPL